MFAGGGDHRQTEDGLLGHSGEVGLVVDATADKLAEAGKPHPKADSQEPGPDGLDGTLDDVTAAPITVPGYTGTPTGAHPSSQHLSLSNFQRQITILNVTNPDGSLNPNLRQVTITIQYPGGQGVPRSYTVQALISAYK